MGFLHVSNVFFPVDGVNELKDFVEKTFILSCVNLKERVLYMSISQFVHTLFMQVNCIIIISLISIYQTNKTAYLSRFSNEC